MGDVLTDDDHDTEDDYAARQTAHEAMCGREDMAALRTRVAELGREVERLLDRLHAIIGIANGDNGPPQDEWSLDDAAEAVRELRAEVARLAKERDDETARADENLTRAEAGRLLHEKNRLVRWLYRWRNDADQVAEADNGRFVLLVPRAEADAAIAGKAPPRRATP